MKLNYDGSARSILGSSGGDGLLRDTNGDFKGAFTNYYGVGTNNKVELRANLDGILLCKSLSYFLVIIESDSKLVVDWFTVGKCNSLVSLRILGALHYRDARDEY